ncbi:DUF3114 domain-containing protein [Streptococcus macacae]|uniref:DUF3114 domain-containing protein n=1 Tax=Streptococcus macacae NCTC 11558 TaxID=764298 RepID=G5JYL1_9STRE|nr:DUF3114 domain-containing protein [Streptococcus macacae]EHJ52527.1 hypothetical protein STRMA_0273 [Streptococcus macacae NCTC 11558]SUN78124.1 hypothetical cytosolic protein [Streptococcus macacae NCTC 11558]
MWRILKSYPFSRSGLQQRYQQAKQLLLWEKAGWSREELKQIAQRDLRPLDFSIGSPVFNLLWQRAYKLKDPQQLLTIVLDMSAMPQELSGHLEENQKLVQGFSDDLAPDSAFWHELAVLVQQVFPQDRMSQKDLLAKRVHQFRYIISSQQAQYIRKHYRKEGMADDQALALFLKTKKGKVCYRKTYDYSLFESARLHNKAALIDGKMTYPDQDYCFNFKILLHFHTEFILDNKGRFLNETDAEVFHLNGVINGASFNYANQGDKRHWELDVDPAACHDPVFRNKAVSNDQQKFISPKWIKRKNQAKSDKEWQESYFNKKGLYAYQGKSSFKQVKSLARRFKREIRKSKSQ